MKGSPAFIGVLDHSSSYVLLVFLRPLALRVMLKVNSGSCAGKGHQADRQ